MPPIRAICFDIDDTLYSTSAFAARARRHAIEAMVRHGLEVPVETAIAELTEVIGEFGSNHPHHYDRLLRRFPKATLPEGSPVLVVAAAVAAYHDTKFTDLKPFDGVHETLERLHARTDLQVGIITEGLAVKQAEKLVRLEVLPWLTRDAIFISDQVGISKPNIKLYQLACERMGLRPEEVLYVGDHPHKDVDPAKSIGMRVVRFRSPGGKYLNAESLSEPDHEIRAFPELLELLATHYGRTELR